MQKKTKIEKDNTVESCCARVHNLSNDGLTRALGNDEVNLPPRNVIGCPSRQIKEQRLLCREAFMEQLMKICHVRKNNLLLKSR
jgi:hypothetical protein